MLQLVAAAVATVGCSCTASHYARDASTVDGAADGETARDAGVCTGLPPRWDEGGPCTPEREAVCRAWADRSAAEGLVGRSTCLQWARPGPTLCTNGDTCYSEGDQPPSCQCAPGLICAEEYEICVSDTPDGPPRCIPSCTDP